MRFFATTALALCLPGAAFADDILLRADVAQALVFARGAEVTRRVSADLPQGRHRLLIPMRDISDPSLIEVSGPDGVRIGVPQTAARIAIPEGALDTGPEADARDAVEAAEDALQAALDALARRDAAIRGLETQLAYLDAIARGGPDGAATPPGPEALAALLGTLGTETARVGTGLQAAREARRDDEEAVDDRRRDLSVARSALQDLNPFGPEAPGIEVEIEVPEAARGDIVISYPTDAAGWAPIYALRLDTQAEALSVERSIALYHSGAATWRDVAMRFSTALPGRRREPSVAFPDPARIAPPPPMPEPAVRSEAAGMIGAETAMEPVMVADAAARMVTTGISVVYEYAAPVTVGPSGQVTLPFDDIALDIALENRAVPRRDANAFLVAMGENDSGEAILPGAARFFRDGELVGAGALPMVPSGAEVEIAFGQLDHLPLIWQDLSLDEGDRGIFVSENEQRRRIVFGVENTSGTAETVRLLYATPFAEQEDLELSVGFSRAPDARDVDDLRGVLAWDITVPAGAEERIEMTVDLSWPEDMILDWRP
ncbi:mucoidy inhibitor MuiA family protein [Roseibacterium sp. SDUM158017]|uniref:mucoidy inhibitor MuiA family protein n=1 Tax=Roseicyclus salinarum TaxID=3036773 RepID=UPI002414FCB8|nr:mucoidy inhibitor MuiA family protein [Roseibacterium sp. SDUM158017]MDG4646849.1 mucoidy inhibitor MuiA family protein [Roseibacterium sp. SDUM158017]